MKLYKDTTGQVFAYEGDGSQDHLIPDGQVQITEAQANALRSPSMSLAQVIAIALANIDQFHADTIQKLVGSPTQVEKDTWSLKLEAASAITNKTTVSAAGQAFLAGAGMTTDAAKAAWAASVLAKSAAYAQVVGLAEKLRDTARTAVKAATDETKLKAALDAQRAAADAAVASLLKGT